MTMASEGQKTLIRELTNKILTHGSVSFQLLDGIDTLTSEEANILITNYRKLRTPFNLYLGIPRPKTLTGAQKNLLNGLLAESELTASEQTALFEQAGSRFLETLTISQADQCINQLTQKSQKRPFTGHA